MKAIFYSWLIAASLIMCWGVWFAFIRKSEVKEGMESQEKLIAELKEKLAVTKEIHEGLKGQYDELSEELLRNSNRELCHTS